MGVLRQEAVHEQKSVSSRTVNISGPPVLLYTCQMDGWRWIWVGFASCCSDDFILFQFNDVSLDVDHIELVPNSIKQLWRMENNDLCFVLIY